MLRRKFLTRSTPPSRSGRPRARNPIATAKRRKTYKAYLSSAAWKAKRHERFAMDGYRCTAMVEYMMVNNHGVGIAMTTARCGVVDNTRTGAGLVCDHVRYSHFGREPMRDLRTLCVFCNARSTKLERPNWMNR